MPTSALADIEQVYPCCSYPETSYPPFRFKAGLCYKDSDRLGFGLAALGFRDFGLCPFFYPVSPSSSAGTSCDSCHFL